MSKIEQIITFMTKIYLQLSKYSNNSNNIAKKYQNLMCTYIIETLTYYNKENF